MTELVIYRGLKICEVEDCDEPTLARGLCRRHYGRWHKGLPLVPGEVHVLDAMERTKPVCRVPGCTRTSVGNTRICDPHRQRLKKHGTVDAERPLIERGSCRFIDPDGYAVLTGRRARPYVGKGKNGSIFEHKAIMETLLGRPLRPGEQVHHRNGVRDDNRPENLELWIRAQPRGVRVADQIRWAKEILAIYGEDEGAW